MMLSAKSFCKKLHNPEKIFHDICARKPDEAEYVDLYITTPPCQAFSPAGRQLGIQDARGQLLKHSVQYVQRKRPRVVLFENVPSIVSKKFKHIARGIWFALEKLGYKCHGKILNSKNFKLSQKRRRFFIVAIRQDSCKTKLKWPKGTGKRTLAEDLDPPCSADKPCRLPTGKRAKELAAAACADVWKKKKVDPRKVPVSVDVDCSRKFANYAINELQTLTRSRGGSRGFWISSRGRKMTISELLKVSGFEPNEVEGYKEAGVADNNLGAMLGNSVPVPLMQAVLASALDASGLRTARSQEKKNALAPCNKKGCSSARFRKHGC